MHPEFGLTIDKLACISRGVATHIYRRIRNVRLPSCCNSTTMPGSFYGLPDGALMPHLFAQAHTTCKGSRSRIEPLLVRTSTTDEDHSSRSLLAWTLLPDTHKWASTQHARRPSRFMKRGSPDLHRRLPGTMTPLRSMRPQHGSRCAARVPLPRPSPSRSQRRSSWLLHSICVLPSTAKQQYDKGWRSDHVGGPLRSQNIFHILILSDCYIPTGVNAYTRETHLLSMDV